MEASLLQAYAPRDPLGEYLRGEITVRQFRVMVQGIARDATTPLGRAIGGPWDATQYLIHSAAMEVRLLNTSLANAFREKGTTAVQLERIPTPEPTHYMRKQARKTAGGEKSQRAVEADLLAVLAQSQEGADNGG